MNLVDTATSKAKTGVSGLDNILSGGLSRGHVFLVEGTPGTGKTTVALQFLLEGAKAGERCLYITLSETERELREGAASHGWVLGDGIEIFELLPPESLLDSDQQQSLLYSSDLELGEATRQIFAAVDRVRPSRVVLDSLSEIRLLAQSSLRYRRQILAIKHYFAKFNTTVMLLDDLTADVADKTVHSLAHGVIRLEELAPDLRRGAPPHPHHQISRRQIPRRLSRRHHRHRRIERVSAAGGLRIPRRFCARQSVERRRRARRAAWRRDRDRFEHAGAWPGGHRQVAGRDRLPARRGRARRKGGDVRVRRGTRPVDGPDERPRHRPRADAAKRATVHRAGRRRRKIARRIRPHGPQACRRGRYQDRGDRQPERLSGGDAGGKLPDPAHP